MLEVAVCDDEKYFLEQEKEWITKYMKGAGYKFKIDTFASGTSFMEIGDKVKQYDIIFLDINMRS